jgi:hypothetical protein
VNKEESLALFAEGRDAWNEWAREKQVERAALEQVGTWNEEEQAWHEAAETDFSDHEFDEDADFTSFVSPGMAVFRGSKFAGNVRFGRVIFAGYAGFGEATFHRNAWFNSAKFGGEAMFGGAKFGGKTWFDEASFGGKAEFGEASFGGHARFNAAKFGGKARFGGAKFGDDAGFGGAKFSDDARFDGVSFGGNTRFGRASFGGSARFGEASFGGHAGFGGAKFGSNARFGAASFGGHAGFDGTNFDGNARFDGASFGGNAGFDDATFEKVASFRAMDGNKAFSLAGVVFNALPDFIQAHFREAPRLDNVRIEPRRFSWPTWSGAKASFKGDLDRTARWQALKRLAIQGHDHVREQLFFKGELKSRRWSTDYPWHALFWFGLIYQWLSDFGRSLVRPPVWWGVGIGVFAALYLGQHPAVEGRESAMSATCIAAPGVPWKAAVGLSLRNGLAVPNIKSNFTSNQIYLCLYGAKFGRPNLPMIPDRVSILGLVQNVFSGALIFLFLLALRNHFRIR